MRVLLAGFHAGEFSPLLEGRLDLEAVRKGCRRLRNAVPRSLGGAFQRPGFLHMGAAHLTDRPARLLPFSFSQAVNYRIELGHQHARFWLADRLCLTQADIPAPAAPVATEVWTPAAAGTAYRELWDSTGAGVTTVDLALAYIVQRAADVVTPAPQTPPTGVGVTQANAVQRFRGMFFFAAGTTYQFRTNGIAGPARVSLNQSLGGGPTGAATILNAPAGGTVASAVYSIAGAARALFMEFVLVRSGASTAGTFEVNVNGGGWVPFTASMFAEPIPPGALPPAEEGPAHGIASAVGEPLRLNTPWTDAEVPEVMIAQANDVTWLAHRNHWPRRLIRYGVEDWRIGEMPVIYPPLRDQNATLALTLRASGTSGTVTLDAEGGNVFEAGDEGGYYELAHRRDLPFADLALTATAVSPDVRVNGKWEVFTYGIWTGTLKLCQRRKGTSEVDVLRTWKSAADFNAQAAGEVDGEQTLFLQHTFVSSSGTNPPRATLSALDGTVRGLVKIKTVVSPTQARAEVVRPLYSVAPTPYWSEGAWSTRRGFPRAVTLHEQRLVFGGTRSEPQKFWASAVNDFRNFERTTLEDSSYAYQVAASQSNPILAMVSQEGLLVLTEGDEWIVDGGDSPTITPSKISAKRRSGTGSEPVQPLLVGSAVLFVQVGGRILCEYVYDFQQNGFEAIDLTELAEHLGAERLTQIAFAQNPHSVLWAVTSAGSLLSLTYKRKNGVVAWAKHSTPFGRFESVCCTPGANGIHEVWVTVRREVAGVVRRSVEKLDIAYWDKLREGNTRALCVADAAVVRSFPEPSAEVTGLAHLEGATVGVLADGAVHPHCVVTGGKIVLGEVASDVVVGLPPVLELQPMPAEIVLDTGSAVGRRMRVADIDVKFWQAGGCRYADKPGGKEYEVSFRTPADPTGAPVPLFTGQRKLALPAQWQDSTNVTLRNTSMLPLNVLAVVFQLAVSGE